MDIAIVHYNTPELTQALVRSVRKFSPSCAVTVFDNSDARPFRMEGVTVIDNTAGQIIDFAGFLSQYPDGIPTASKFGSVKHTMSVDRLFDILPGGFILLDSDILLTQDVTCFADAGAAWAGTVRANRWVKQEKIPRLLPMLCWLNVPLCRKHGIRYFDSERSWQLRPGMYWDTGASFLADCDRAQLRGKSVNIDRYMVHYGHGSWSKTDPVDWLRENKQFYL